VSWAALALLAARARSFDESLIDAVPGHTLGRRAARPRHAALASERGALMPTLEDALARYLLDITPDELPGPEEDDAEGGDGLQLVA